MNIGILTYHWVYNFGANLQTLSTIIFIKSKGLTPIVIDYRPIETENWYKSIVPQDEINAFIKFGNKFYQTTNRCLSVADVNVAIKENRIKGTIIGSDALFNLVKPYWSFRKFKRINPTPDHRYPNPFWGGLICPYSGLSISSQNCKFTNFEKDKKSISKNLKSFRLLTVRDNWTQKLVSYFTNNEIIPDITPDPVFAFNEHGNNLIIPKADIISKYQLSENYILYNPGDGVISESWINEFSNIAHHNNLEIVQLPHTLSPNLGKIEWPLDPIEWYSLIVHSKGYVGILMHPIVVCLHNNIPFFSFDQYGLVDRPLESSKTYHILSKANFTENYYNTRFGQVIPTPEYVFNCIVNFNTEKCNAFSQSQKLSALKNMNNILTSIL